VENAPCFSGRRKYLFFEVCLFWQTESLGQQFFSR